MAALRATLVSRIRPGPSRTTWRTISHHPTPARVPIVQGSVVDADIPTFLDLTQGLARPLVFRTPHSPASGPSSPPKRNGSPRCSGYLRVPHAGGSGGAPEEDAISLFLDWLTTQTHPRERLLRESLEPLRPQLLRTLASPPSFSQFHAPSPSSSPPWPTTYPPPRRPSASSTSRTPWHKVLRLMSPTAGDALFRRVQAALGKSGSSRIRLSDMMHGPERDLLHRAVWESPSASPGETVAAESAGPELVEARVGPGDALFVPVGWWHSVQSEGSAGALNASANWWFR
ncbi:unnamed protein product [Parascedosporium putredinis]|uniref:JmjC domain-containing protein n=1 Tax=Parascedosporium putredinis TaxID=1442378 RepID=A0A9P1H3R2_9PEZI|nr:unnamed protein product [Parascedosporium putredinis]CAI7996081.1 unnamed protein product [Parascedosporium putredinis]